MKWICYLLLLTASVRPALAQTAVEPYADDVLRAQANDAAAVEGCPAVMLSGHALLDVAEAEGLLCMAVKQLPLAERVIEYGCTDRSELVIGALLQTGVPYEALGRISTFYDTARNTGGKAVFQLADPYHGDEFYRAWQLVFGTEFPRNILLRQSGEELKLDVDGQIQWNIGHIAPTIWVRTAESSTPQLRVFDPVLSPERVLTPEEWRSLQQAEAAAIAWGPLGQPPVLMAEYLPASMLSTLKRQLNLPPSQEIDSDSINRLLQDSSPEMRAQIEGVVLDIPAKSDWHPLKWQGYSFAGGQTDMAGSELPEWQPGRGDITQRRVEAAAAKLALLQTYQDLRASFADDEAFLQEVKRRMLAQNKSPNRVVIDFNEGTP